MISHRRVTRTEDVQDVNLMTLTIGVLDLNPTTVTFPPDFHDFPARFYEEPPRVFPHMRCGIAVSHNAILSEIPEPVRKES